MINLILLSLATYGLTRLISQEKGPYEIIKKFRKLIGIYENEIEIEDEMGLRRTVIEKYNTNEFAVLIDCVYCLSFWISLGLCFVFLPFSFDLILNWLAVYGLVYLILKATDNF